MAERALAHIEKIADLQELPGYDRVVLATILGWKVIVAKDDFKVGDLCVYFEIDSKLPEEEWSEFLRPKHFKVKTQKMCKTISQGLAIPLESIPELKDRCISEGLDVTKLLNVTYAVPEDNARKSNKIDPNAKYKSMAARHHKLFKKKPIRWLMKRDWGKKLLFLFLGKKRDNIKRFPEWIKKTDETRCENIPWILENKDVWIRTEKIDGTSSTYAIDFTKNKKCEFIVCSRNVRQVDRNQKNWHDLDDNVYWEMVDKYDIEIVLRKIAKRFHAKRVVLQGETYGAKLQGNPYNLKDRRFAAFNLIIDDERLGSLAAEELLMNYNVPFVPVLDPGVLPDDMETLKLEADGYSTINQKVKREGIVYRSLDGKHSFKNVSREYLLKHS